MESNRSSALPGLLHQLALVVCWLSCILAHLHAGKLRGCPIVIAFLEYRPPKQHALLQAHKVHSRVYHVAC